MAKFLDRTAMGTTHIHLKDNIQDRRETMGKFEIFKGKNGAYYFRLKAANGEIIATSEGYVAKQSAQAG